MEKDREHKTQREYFEEENLEYIIGVDEAGRGPLAGPLVFGFLGVSREVCEDDNYEDLFTGIKDSKKLSEKKRKEIFERLKELKKENKIDFCVLKVGNEEIDKVGLAKCIKKILKTGKEYFENKNNKKEKIKFLLDGGLKLEGEVNQETIIKGDLKVPLIGLASILAKVTRDRLMEELAKDYLDYNFSKHKGYGTKAHIEEIKKFGPSKIHRLSFLKNILK